MSAPQTPPRPRRISPNMLRLAALLIVAAAAGIFFAGRPTTDPEALAAQARAYVQDFQYEDALRTAQDALDIVRDGLYPPEYVAKFHLLRGQTWLVVYEWDAALRDYNAAIELAPAYPEGYYLRGNLFAIRSEVDLAINDFARAVELDPTGIYADDARDAIDVLESQRDALNAP